MLFSHSKIKLQFKELLVQPISCFKKFFVVASLKIRVEKDARSKAEFELKVDTQNILENQILYSLYALQPYFNKLSKVGS